MRLLLAVFSLLTISSLLMLVVSVGAWIFGSATFEEMIISVLIWGVAFFVVAALGNRLWRSMGSPDS